MGLAIEGVPVASFSISAAPAEVILAIDGEPLACFSISAVPAEVGFAMLGVPEAVSIPVPTVTAIQAISSSDCRSIPNHSEPVRPPTGSVNVRDVPAAFAAVTVISLAPDLVCVVFRYALGHINELPLEVGFAIDGVPEAVRVVEAGGITTVSRPSTSSTANDPHIPVQTAAASVGESAFTDNMPYPS